MSGWNDEYAVMIIWCQDETMNMLADSADTGHNVTGVPQSNEGDRIENWLQDTKGLEKDLTGLYREVQSSAGS